MKDRKTNIWDFMCDHPFISMMIISSICETVSAIIRPRKKVSYIFQPTDCQCDTCEDPGECKECGSTEEEGKS